MFDYGLSQHTEDSIRRMTLGSLLDAWYRSKCCIWFDASNGIRMCLHVLPSAFGGYGSIGNYTEGLPGLVLLPVVVGRPNTIAIDFTMRRSLPRGMPSSPTCYIHIAPAMSGFELNARVTQITPNLFTIKRTVDGGCSSTFGVRTFDDFWGRPIKTVFPLLTTRTDGYSALPPVVAAFEKRLVSLLRTAEASQILPTAGGTPEEALATVGPYVVNAAPKTNRPVNRLDLRVYMGAGGQRGIIPHVPTISLDVGLTTLSDIDPLDAAPGDLSATPNFTERFLAVRKARRLQEKDASMANLKSLTTSAPLPLAQTLVRDTVSSFADVAMARVLSGAKSFIKEQVSTSVVIDTNAGRSPSVPRISMAFDAWYSKNIGDRFQRTFDLVTTRQDEEIGADNFQPSARVGVVQSFGGTSNTRTLWFPWNGRVYWANILLSAAATNNDCRFSTIEFCTYGRSKLPLTELLKFLLTYWKDNLEVPPEIPVDGKRVRARDIQVFRSTRGTWHGRHGTPGRLLSSMIIDDEITEKVVDGIAWWQDNKDWYDDRGIGYKKTFVFEGEAGCGKTTLSRALATHFLRPIYQINLAQVSDDAELISLFESIPAGSIILIEEFDTCTQLLNRELRANVDEMNRRSKEMATTESNAPLNSGITLGTMLDILDGAVPLTNQIVILTTNKIKDVDPALIRDGRVDVRVQVKAMTNDGIHQYVKRMFPDYVRDPSVEFASRPGSTVQKIYFNNRNSADDFVKALLKP